MLGWRKERTLLGKGDGQIISSPNGGLQVEQVKKIMSGRKENTAIRFLLACIEQIITKSVHKISCSVCGKCDIIIDTYQEI